MKWFMLMMITDSMETAKVFPLPFSTYDECKDHAAEIDKVSIKAGETVRFMCGETDDPAEFIFTHQRRKYSLQTKDY